MFLCLEGWRRGTRQNPFERKSSLPLPRARAKRQGSNGINGIPPRSGRCSWRPSGPGRRRAVLARSGSKTRARGRSPVYAGCNLARAERGETDAQTAWRCARSFRTGRRAFGQPPTREAEPLTPRFGTRAGSGPFSPNQIGTAHIQARE